MSRVDTDLALLQRFTERGDQAAFAEIVRRYAGMTCAVGRRILHDRARAEEVSQEAFYRLMTRPGSVSQSLGGWLHRAATRLAVDERRSDAARRRREAEAAAEQVATAQVQAEADAAGPRWADVSPHVDESLAALPDDARDLLVRHFLRGEAQQDMAVEMKTSAATLSRRMKAAVDLLRREMRRRGVDVAPAVLVGLFAGHGVEQASASLLGELGKMTMVSGMRGMLSPHAAAGWAARVADAVRTICAAHTPIGAALLTGTIVTALVLLLRPGPPRFQTQTAPMLDAAGAGPAGSNRSTPSAGSAANLCGPVITVSGGDATDVRSDRIVLVQHIVSNPRMWHVVFGDNHVEDLQGKDANLLVLAQSGKTLAQLEAAAQSPRRPRAARR